MVKIKLTLPCILHPTPAVSQHGTSTAVETAIANNKTQWPNDQDGAMHHDEPSSLLFPLDSLHHPKASYHIKTIMPSKVNLGAIKKKCYLMFNVLSGTATSHAVLFRAPDCIKQPLIIYQATQTHTDEYTNIYHHLAG